MALRPKVNYCITEKFTSVYLLQPRMQILKQAFAKGSC